jgi:hypothetical protein
LPHGHQAWEYLRERGFGPKEAKEYYLGYSTGSGLYEHLTSQGYLPSVILQKKVCKRNKKSDRKSTVVDFFGKGRLIFPCLLEGRAVGFTSRICYETDNPAIPRYKNLGKSSYFFYSPDSVKANEDLYIVEGPFDALRLRQWGLNAVCFFGTSGFKKSYAKHICKASKIYGIPDVEEGSQSWKSNMGMYINITNATGRLPHIISLPFDGKHKVDPADYFLQFLDFEQFMTHMRTLKRMAIRLDQTPEWRAHCKKLETRFKKEQTSKDTKKEGDALEKFPIIPTLELLEVEVFFAEGMRPSCRCFNPEHEDNNPSVVIYEETQTFHCWGAGCSRPGHDAIDAVRMVKGLNFMESIDWIKENLYERHGTGST